MLFSKKSDRAKSKVNIYLDVDGVLLKSGKPAPYVDDFVSYLDSNYRGSIYWLTTHCSGSTEPVMAYMRHSGVREDTLSLMRYFKPTYWPIVKVQAIDFSQSFLWFDDNLLHSEKAILTQHGALDNYIKVDLDSKPYSLQVFIQDFPEVVQNK